MMLIIGLFVIAGLPAAVIEAKPENTGPPFVEEIYDAIDAEAAARIAADATIVENLGAASAYLQSNIDAEGAARIAADATIAETLGAAIAYGDSLLQLNIVAEEEARIAGDTALWNAMDAEDAALQEQIDAIVVSAIIPITQADMPLTITQNGSYYLTEDVNSSGTAITVAVDDVTIDLCGYAVVGQDSGTNYGIYMNGRSNVEIRNGTVRDFCYGIYETSSGQSHRIINVRIISNTQRGIHLGGSGHLVKDCTVSENGTSATSSVYGIRATGNGCTVTGNTVYNNGYSANGYVYGINVYTGSTVTCNTVCNNGYSANYVESIRAGNGCRMMENTVSNNGTEASGFVYGINVGNGSTVTGNTARNNGDSAGGNVWGIYANTGSTVTGNTAYDNGDDAGGNVYGIRLGSYSLVDQNTAYSNGSLAGGSAVNITYGGTGCVYGINVPAP